MSLACVYINTKSYLYTQTRHSPKAASFQANQHIYTATGLGSVD